VEAFRGASFWPPETPPQRFRRQLGSEPAGTGIKLARLRRGLKPLEDWHHPEALERGACLRGDRRLGVVRPSSERNRAVRAEREDGT